MVYIYTKFLVNILNGLRVVERSLFVTDRQTDRLTVKDGQTDIYGKNNMSPAEWGI